jgi:putative ABC transport system permease protein
MAVTVPFRSLLRTPGFGLLAVVTLALGIGANAAIFSVVHGVLLRPLPLPEPDRLVAIRGGSRVDPEEQTNVSDAAYLVLRAQNRSLEEMGIYWSGSVNLTGGSEPERAGACGATASVLGALRVTPALGRPLVEADEQPGADPVAVISHEMWRRSFGGAPDVLGRVVRIDSVPRRVVGVMPPGFAFPRPDTAVWIPMTIDRAALRPQDFNYESVGRLRPGVTAEEAARDLTALIARFPEEIGPPYTPEVLEAFQPIAVVQDLRQETVGDVARTLWVLLGSAGLILLIACANVANLFLVRAEGRRREVAVRVALGASRGSVARLFLAESSLLALAGGALGLALAAAGVRLLLTLRPPGLPRLDEIAVGGPVVAFTVLVALFAGLLAGGLAVLRSARPELVPDLKDGGKGSTGGRSAHRARRILAAAQIAVALVLLVGAALMIKSFRRLQAVDPGFRPEGVLTLRLALPRAEYPDAQAVAGFVRDLQERVRAVPGVRSAALLSHLPLDGGSSNSTYAIEGQLLQDASRVQLDNRFASPGTFATLGIPVIEGTEFERIDPLRRQGEVVVSRSVAERFWPGQSPLGKRLTPAGAREGEWYTIVGVVGDVHEESLHAEPSPVVYFGWRRLASPEEEHWVPRGGTLVVRTEGDPAVLAKPVREAIRAVDPALPVDRVRTMQEVVARSTARASFTLLLLGLAALLALLLGGVGIYGVIAYIVSLRTQEIGVRMALGARRTDISFMVLRDGLVLALAGVGVGLAAAFAFTRPMASLLFEVSPTDPATFATVPLFLALVTLLASWLPAQKAASVAPTEALRSE